MTFSSQLKQFREFKTLSESDALLSRMMTDMHCELFSYNYYPHHFQQTHKARHVLCPQPIIQWQTHYTTQAYDNIDPIFQRMRHHQLPLGWRIQEELKKYNQHQAEKQFFSDALDFGLEGGFAIPIHAPAGEFANLVVQDATVLTLIESHPDIEYQLQMLAYHYHASVSRLLRPLTQTPTLTKRETQCLALTAQHKSAKQIAALLNISPRTVGFHLENAMKKLNVNSKFAAIAKIPSVYL